MNFLKECNRAISSAMGVPLILFNYNEGNTYATSKISAKFLAGYGGGLLRTIEIDTKEMLQKSLSIGVGRRRLRTGRTSTSSTTGMTPRSFNRRTT